MRDYSKFEHITPMRQRFIDARRIDNGVLISRKHRNSDEVLVITQGTKWIVPETGYYCSAHGGWSMERCECNYETRIL